MKMGVGNTPDSGPTDYLAIGSTTAERASNNCDGRPCSLSHRLPRISEYCLSQPAWTTTTKRTEQILIVRSGKSEAEVTDNRRLRSTYCTIEANYCQTRSIARPLCNSRTTCLHFIAGYKQTIKQNQFSIPR